MLGKDIGPYRVIDEIGAGGMGTVYRAEVIGHVPGVAVGAIVALKVVHPHLLRNQGFFKRFLREGEIGKSITHPNVVATLDLDGIKVGGDTVLYIAREYVEGQSLWDLYQELGPVSEELCMHFAREITRGLAAIHAKSVVHRDLKPENVLVSAEHVVKIMDLGVARLADETERLSGTGMFVGSTLYAAPEQFAATEVELDARTDLHALGAMLYELSTGTHPYDATQPALVVKRLLEETPRRLADINPQLSPFFEEVVHVLLEKKPEDRFASATALLEVLTEGEKSAWWRERAKLIRARTAKPLRRAQAPNETPLFGRDNEMALLKEKWERAKAGEGGVVLIEGEAGIGKTRLVEEFVARLGAESAQFHYLCGGFPPGDAAAGSSAFAAALRGFFGADAVEESVRLHLAETPLLVDAFSALLRGEPTPSNAEPLTRESLQTVFLHVIRSIAAERPTIFFCEDLHLASPQGLALFAALAMGVAEHRVLLIGSARPGVLETGTTAVTRILHARRVVLSRLGLKDLARLLVAAVGSEQLADEIGFQIVVKSDGNPFFIFEILRSLREQGVLVQDRDGDWRTTRPVRDIVIPSSLREIVRARIASLTDEERDVLEPAACCGFEFDPRLVGDAMKLDRVVLLRRLAKIERAHRLVHSLGDRYVFDHHEVREALRDGVPDVLRREYHGAIAETLEARLAASGTAIEAADGAVVVEIADHFLSAGLGERAMRFAVPAIEHLDRTYAADLATDLAARVLASPAAPTGDARVEMLLRQAERLDILGRREEERVVLDEARTLADAAGDPRLRARTRIGAARWCTNLALYEDALPLAGEARAIAVEAKLAGVEADALGVLGKVCLELARYDEARGHHEREIEIRRATEDKEGEAAATGRLGAVLRRQGRYEEAYKLFVRDLSLNRATRSRLGKAIVKRNIGGVLLALGRYEDALTHFSRSLSISRLIGYRRGEAMALTDMGEACQMLGDPDAAGRHLYAAMRLCVETGIRYVHGRALHALAARSAASADPGMAFRRAQRAVRLRRDIGDRAGLATSLLLLGRLRKMAGAVKVARDAFEEAGALGRELDLPGERVLAAVHLAALPEGDAEPALREFAAHERRLEIADRMEARFLLWQATGDAEHLDRASALLDHVVSHVAEERRDKLLANVALHRNVAAAISSPWAKRPRDGD